MIRNKRKYYEPCDKPESTILATLAHLHGPARFDINALVIPGMSSELIGAGLAVLEVGGYLRIKGDTARLSSVGVENGLAIFSITMSRTQPAAGSEPTYALFHVNRLTGETVRYHPDRFRTGSRQRLDNFAEKVNSANAKAGVAGDQVIKVLRIDG